MKAVFSYMPVRLYTHLNMFVNVQSVSYIAVMRAIQYGTSASYLHDNGWWFCQERSQASIAYYLYLEIVVQPAIYVLKHIRILAGKYSCLLFILS